MTNSPPTLKTQSRRKLTDHPGPLDRLVNHRVSGRPDRTYQWRPNSRLPSVPGFVVWVQRYLDEGWTAYHITFMFKPLPGNESAILQQMTKEIEAVFGSFMMRVVRWGNRRPEPDRCPRLIAFPDRPGHNKEKKSLREVVINGGLHFHGILLIPPASRVKEIVNHFEKHQPHYLQCGVRRLERIQVNLITIDHARVVDYDMKTVVKGRIDSEEDFLILPKSNNEMPSKQPIARSASTSFSNTYANNTRKRSPGILRRDRTSGHPSILKTPLPTPANRTGIGASRKPFVVAHKNRRPLGHADNPDQVISQTSTPAPRIEPRPSPLSITHLALFSNDLDPRTHRTSRRRLQAMVDQGLVHSIESTGGYHSSYIVPLTPDPSGAAHAILRIDPRYPRLPKCRLEFNPSELGPSGVEAIISFLSLLNQPMAASFFERAHVSRIDVALDLFGVSLDEVVITSGQKRTYRSIAHGPNAAPVTYLGPFGSDQTVAYTKQFPELPDSPIALRLERRIRPKCTVGDLISLPNPFEEVQVISVATLRQVLPPDTFQKVLDDMRCWGVARTLSLMSKEQRRAIQDVLRQYHHSAFTEVWAQWHSSLAAVGLQQRVHSSSSRTLRPSRTLDEFLVT